MWSYIKKKMHPAAAVKADSDAKALSKWRSVIKGEADRLGGLSGSTEDAFVAMGKDLQEYALSAQGLEKTAGRMVGLMRDEDITASISRLHDIIGTIGNHLTGARRLLDDAAANLESYMGMLQGVSSSMASMEDLFMNLHMLGFYTRVENAQTNDAATGFSGLALDVTRLSNGIKEKTIEIASQVSGLLVVIDKAIHDVHTMSEKSGQYMIETISNQSSRLKGQYDLSDNTAGDIEQMAGDIAGSISAISLSLQSNDITRQQIEHVQENLCEMLKDLGLSQKESSELLAHVCTLGCRQLSMSTDELYTAVEQVKSNMGEIAGDVKTISEKTISLAYSDDAGRNAFLKGVDDSMAQVIAFLNENEQEQVQIGETIAKACSMVKDMAVFIKDIDTMSFQLQLIAINARIKAAHMGSRGAALDVLSGSIYELSANSRQDILQISNSLKTMAASADAFGSQIETHRKTQHDHTLEITSQMSGIMDLLKRKDSDANEFAAEIRDIATALQSDIHTSIAGIHVHETVSQALNETKAHLNEAIQEIGSIYPDWKDAHNTKELNEIIKRYTMEEERVLHRNTMQDAAAEPQVVKEQEIIWNPHGTEKKQIKTRDIQASEEEPGDDLGDNIELF
ncbi:MAG: hypothetical protein U9P80_09640 [Thermodesulfobacteriota bacterium]|nr:hypothetical protein [Thermodesulfobacteriota bacterium]